MRSGCVIDSPIGELTIVMEGTALSEIRFGADVPQDVAIDERSCEPVVAELREYFEGKRTEFSVTLHPKGTDFQRKVWDELSKIPYGETCSYLDIASRLGDPKATRAVGAANGRNPIPIIVPCHRVIGRDGKLTGFGGGLPIKQALLDLEQFGPRA